jgi:hypothetical protein
MTVYPKKDLLEEDYSLFDVVKNQKDVLRRVDHPFIQKTHYIS